MRMIGRKKRKTFLCQVLLCALLLAGCHSLPAENREEPKSKEQREGEEALKDAKTEEEDKAAFNKERLLSIDPGFWNCVCYCAGIEEEDTEAVIQEKLDKCESLELW